MYFLLVTYSFSLRQLYTQANQLNSSFAEKYCTTEIQLFNGLYLNHLCTVVKSLDEQKVKFDLNVWNDLKKINNDCTKDNDVNAS